MPHITIKHFPAPLTAERKAALAAAVTAAVQEAFACDEGVVSIALEPVAPDAWDEAVYRPEIAGRPESLLKRPNY